MNKSKTIDLARSRKQNGRHKTADGHHGRSFRRKEQKEQIKTKIDHKTSRNSRQTPQN